MSQDFLAALVRSAEVMQGNDGKKAPVQLHLLTGDGMSPELQELLSSSGITAGAQKPVHGSYFPMDTQGKKPCTCKEETHPKQEEGTAGAQKPELSSYFPMDVVEKKPCTCNKEEQPKQDEGTAEAESNSGEPVILITSHGRQYDSIKKFLASEGCRDINTFFDVWKNTDDIAKALSMVVGEIYEDIPVRVFNIKFDNYKEVCRHFYLAVSDVELCPDEAVSMNKVTKEELTDSRVLSKLLSEIVFQLTMNVKER